MPTFRDGFDVARSALLARRIRLGWTQEDLARRMGCSPSYIGQLERRVHVPQYGTLRRWAGALGFDVHIALTDIGRGPE